MDRQALVVGVVGTAGSLEDESPPKWQPLPYAAPYAQRLREVLGEQYSFVLLDPDPDPASTAAALGDALTGAVEAGAAFTVVHLLGHGEPTRNSHGLQAVGGDGRLTEALSRWVDMAENLATEGDREPAVLLVLDLCHSGAVVTEHLRSLIRPERRRVWVLAACQSDQSAYDGRLSLAVDDVLRGFASGALRLDESHEYIPIDRFCREVALNLESRSAGSYPQTVERPLVALGTDLSHLRFFPNPRHDPSRLSLPGGPGGRAGVDPAVFAFLDDVADARHFVGRAHGGSGAATESGLPTFTGRNAELRELTAWAEGQGAPVRIVTGVPGAGKSSLVGILACAAHPSLREATEHLWRPSAGDLPDVVQGLAVVHARRRTVAEVLSSLAAQWNLDSPGATATTTWTTDRLVAALRTRAEPPHLIVDAVDEAEYPADLVTALLLPLLSGERPDTKPLCRVLIATRREEGLRHLFEAANRHGAPIDLDHVPAARLRKDLVNFVSRVLRPETDTLGWCSLSEAEGLGRAMAGALLGGARQWGEFLVAGLYLRLLREQATPPADAAAAEALGRSVPRTLGAVLDLDLAFLARPGLRELLIALAWAEGDGMPERLLARVADLASAMGHEPADAAELLQAARFYVRRNVDRDGTPLYRLFHEGLADELRSRPGLDAAIVWERLLATVREPGARRGRWASAEPYLLRHAARHSAAAGRLEELLEDSGFLVHADPAPLVEELYHSAPTPRGAVYLTSYGAHHDGPPDQRRAVLAVDAARHQQWQLSAELACGTGWRIGWTAGRDLHPGLLRTLTGHRGGISDMTTLVLQGRPHVLTAGRDGTARLWDVNSAGTTHELTGHGSPVNCVATTEVDGALLAATACEDGVLRGWDLATGRCLWTERAHTGPIRSMVAMPCDGVPAFATAGTDKVVRFWHPATGEPLSTLPLQSHPVHGEVWQLSHVVVPGFGDCVVACYDDWLSVLTVRGEEPGDEDLSRTWPEWATRVRYVDRRGDLEPVSGDREGTVWIGYEVLDDGHAAAVTDLVCVALEGSDLVVSASEDGTARLIETGPPWRARQVASHTTKITRAAVVHDGDGARLLTASEGGTVRIWDLTAEAVPQRHPGHVHTVTGLLALSGNRLVSCSDDGTLALWDTVTGERRQVNLLADHDGRPVQDTATGIAVLEDGERPRIVASCSVEGLALWDTSAAEQVLLERVDGSLFRTAAVVPAVIDGVPHIVCAGRQVELFSVDRVDYLARWPHEHPDRSEAPARERDLGLPGDVFCLAASATHVFAGYRSGAVRSAPLQGPPTVRELTRHQAPVWVVTAVEFDGRLHVVSGDHAGGLRVTAFDGGSRIDLVGHTRAVLAVAPAALDGRPHLLTGGMDRSMRLWDLTTGQQRDVFWFPDTVGALAVAGDGTVFAGVGPDIIRLERHDHRHR
ncbi:hypothetical protein [Kitasatospora sp. NPDC051705]|uniref:hypothetical protein n=1 Tax=Kitasatospora sp. NPDC051705 TaxID=3364057 RepID=UPI0037A3A798